MNITKEIIFFKDYAENKTGKLIPDHFLFFKRGLYGIKANGLQFSFKIFCQPSAQDAINTNCIKLQIIDPEMFNLEFLEKDMRIVSP